MPRTTTQTREAPRPTSRPGRGATASTTRPQKAPQIAGARHERIIPVYVWQLPVRLVHWTIFFSIVILSVTGYYIYNPFIVVGSHAGSLMLWMRFIHEVTAFVFTAAFLVRIYWFFAGNQYAHWRAFVPLTRPQWRNAFAMLKFYLFLRWRSPARVGHNALAALAYLAIYVLMLVQILTGFGLYARVVGTGIWHTLFMWVPGLIDVQYLRATHLLLMFIFIAFTVHHVYSGLLVSAEEKNGLMGSIISGYKFVSERVLREEAVIQGEPVESTLHEPADGVAREPVVPAEAVPTASPAGADGRRGRR